MADLVLRPERRDRIVRSIAGALEGAVPGSTVRLRGSLADGTVDDYSDVDLAWIVPDAACEADDPGAAEMAAQARELVDRLLPRRSVVRLRRATGPARLRQWLRWWYMTTYDFHLHWWLRTAA